MCHGRRRRVRQLSNRSSTQRAALVSLVGCGRSSRALRSSGKQANYALFQRSFSGIRIGQAIKRPVAAYGPDCNVRRSWVRCYRRGEIGTSSSRPGRTWRTASTISVVCSLTNGHRLESRTTIPMLVCWRFCWCLMFWSAVTRTSYLFSSARLMSAPLAKPAQPCSSAVST